MKHEAIVTVARLRRLARDQARQDLTRAVTAEAAAAARADEATRRIADEAAAASSLTADDAAVETFAAWLPAARQYATETRALCERASAEVGRMRAVLTASCTASEAVEMLLAQRAEVRANDDARRMQSELDEAGHQITPS